MYLVRCRIGHFPYCAVLSSFDPPVTREHGGHAQHSIQVRGFEPPDMPLYAREDVGADLSLPDPLQQGATFDFEVERSFVAGQPISC